MHGQLSLAVLLDRGPSVSGLGQLGSAGGWPDVATAVWIDGRWARKGIFFILIFFI